MVGGYSRSSLTLFSSSRPLRCRKVRRSLRGSNGPPAEERVRPELLRAEFQRGIVGGRPDLAVVDLEPDLQPAVDRHQATRVLSFETGAGCGPGQECRVTHAEAADPEDADAERDQQRQRRAEREESAGDAFHAATVSTSERGGSRRAVTPPSFPDGAAGTVRPSRGEF